MTKLTVLLYWDFQEFLKIKMSFDTVYKNRKDWRKPYRRSLRFDRSCRNHGDCGYCENNRTYFDKKLRYAADEELRNFKKMIPLYEVDYDDP